MKPIYILTVLLSIPIFCLAQDKDSASTVDAGPIQMHEQMMKAHQQAADCLKSGKSEEECRTVFRESCRQAGSPGNCGPWMMKKRSGTKDK